MSDKCKGCNYCMKGNCNLNECIYADVLYDLRKALDDAARIEKIHNTSHSGIPVWYRNIKELIDKAAGIELKNDSQERTCPACKHYVLSDHGFYYCEKWDCEFEEGE